MFGAIHVGIMFYALKRGLHVVETKPDDRYKESPLMYYVNCMSTLGNIVSHLTTHFETLVKGKHESEIYRKLEEIDEIFATKLKNPLDYKQLQKKYIRQTIGVFILCTFISITSTLITIPIDKDNFVRPTLIFAILIIRGRGCQIALVLNVLCDILLDLKILLKRQQLNYRRNCSELLNGFYPAENIRYYRKIYSSIWLIKTLISDCFGWSLITFLVQFTIDLINSSYWVYINLTVFESKSMSTRK